MSILSDLIKEFPDFCQTGRDKIKAAIIIQENEGIETKKYIKAYEVLFADVFDMHKLTDGVISDDHLRNYLKMFPFYNGRSSVAVEEYMKKNGISFE